MTPSACDFILTPHPPVTPVVVTSSDKGAARNMFNPFTTDASMTLLKSAESKLHKTKNQLASNLQTV